MKIILTIFLVFLGGCTAANQQKEQAVPSQELSMEEVCAVNTCRTDVNIILKTEGEDFKRNMSIFWPVVQGDTISILAGERLYIEAEIDGGKLTGFKHVETISAPGKTLVFEFAQSNSDIGMMLSIKNPFAQELKYHLEMMDFRGEFFKTSSCPVIAGGGAFENWPHPIVQLIVHDLRLLPENSNLPCEY